LKSTYKSAGVDISEGNEAVERIKDLAKSTFDKNVLSGIGLFGAFYRLDIKKYSDPVLVSSVDGVGTKLKIAFAMKKHDTIGQDLVNHCVNDIAVCGAQPLFFLDYMAFGKLDINISTEIVKGFTVACKENNCSLIGGETAEMPGLYQHDEYDLSGTIVGIVEKSEIIDGKNIQRGDVIIGISSNGLHTNGYSLARKVLLGKYELDQHIKVLGTNLGDELLKIHKSYLKLINILKSNISIKGMAHITGGGIKGNIFRIIPEGMNAKIQWGNWEQPAIFNLIQESGDIDNTEMRKAFNVGIGLAVIIPRDQEELAFQLILEMKEHPLIIGEIE
jgi:phosphoribosylformylglycinamidine cyclo-ligase